MSRHATISGSCTLLWLLAAAHPAFGLTIELPPETARLAPGPGVEAASAYCTICHSVDYITTQPRGMPKAFWSAIVLKMKKAYGAPLPDDQIEPLTDYLDTVYGAAAKHGPDAAPAKA
jgi:hypothetical protein